MKPNTGHRLLIAGLVVAGVILAFELFLASRKNNQGQTTQDGTNTDTNQKPVYLVPDASSGNYTLNTRIQDSYNTYGHNATTNNDNDTDASHTHLPPPQPPPVHVPPQPPPTPSPQPPPPVGHPGGSGPPPPPPPRYAQYAVRPGDTLSKIAAQYGQSWQTLYSVNQNTIDSTARSHGKTDNFFNWIFPGETLQVPLN